jgi:hypothetical protein
MADVNTPVSSLPVMGEIRDIVKEDNPKTWDIAW